MKYGICAAHWVFALTKFKTLNWGFTKIKEIFAKGIRVGLGCVLFVLLRGLRENKGLLSLSSTKEAKGKCGFTSPLSSAKDIRRHIFPYSQNLP
jgi:hypothetical protein